MGHSYNLRLSLSLLSLLNLANFATADSSESTIPYLQSFVGTVGKTVPFDPYQFYGISATPQANAIPDKKVVFSPFDAQARQLFCTSPSGVQIGDKQIDSATLKQNAAFCTQFDDNKSIIGKIIGGAVAPIGKILSKSHAADAWVVKCTSLCTTDGHAQDWCSAICNMQANNDEGNSEPADPLLVSSCDSFKKNKFSGVLPTETARMHPRLKNTIFNDGQKCRAVIFLLQDYDWQKPLQQAESDCPAGSKPNTVNFAYNQCIVVDSAAPLSIRYFDGPSIAHTAEAIHAIAKYPEAILEIAGLMVAIPPIYGALLGVGEEALAVVLAKYKALFWWSGVSHDFCYHNGLTGHGTDKLACDKAFLSENLKVCKASGPSQDLGHSCEAWAELFYWILRFDLKSIFIPGYGRITLSFSQSSWDASNYGYNYRPVDVAGASAQDHPPVPVVKKSPPVNLPCDQTIGLKLTVLGQDKALSSVGLISLHFSNGETVGQFAIDKQAWHDGSVHTFTAGVSKKYTLLELQGLEAFVSMDFRTHGYDRLAFDLQISMKLDNLGNVQEVFNNQEVGHCGAGCVLGSCPTNACSYTSPTFSITAMKQAAR